jgi:amidase
VSDNGQTRDLTRQTAASLAREIREGVLSSEEVVEAHLRRIEEINPRINAVVQLAETARAEARGADEARARGESRGPLHGVPFTAKDWLDTKGIVSAADYAGQADSVPHRDASVIARLRAAGAILLGKTNTLEENAVYGPTRNPYDLERSPGASSSGEAALIAACGSPVGLGSDSGGSIRYPAHCCGVAGLKPTNGLVPNTGHFPAINAMNDPRTQIGPLARSVEDLGLILPIIAGADWRDPGVIPMPIGDFRKVDVSSLRVSHYTEQADAVPTAETVAAVESAANALANAGALVEAARPPAIDDAFGITLDYWRRTRSLSWSEWRPTSTTTLSGDDVDRSLFRWDVLRGRMLEFMESRDVLVAPVCAHPAPAPPSGVHVYLYTLPYSLTGWPCVVVRAGSDPSGLPIGVQVVARPWRDDVVLAAALVIEQSLGGWQPTAL